MKIFLSWTIAVVFAALQIAVFAPDILNSSAGTLKVALVGPMSGPQQESGQEMVAGAQAFIDRYNSQREALSPSIEIEVFDDQNDPVVARQMAQEIAADEDILAVLGHLSDASATEAAEVYRDTGLPAITGASGLQAVTFQNNWFFRVGMTTAHQGTFLANYLARVMNADEVYIIGSTDPYGASMATAVIDELNFQRRLSAFRVDVLKTFEIDEKSPTLEQDLQAIAEEIVPTYTGQPVVLAVPESIAATVVYKLQSNQRRRLGRTIPYLLIGPDSLGKASVRDALAEFRSNRFGLQDYAEGLHAVAPFLEDVANQRARDFRSSYAGDYGREATDIAGGFHDAAAVVTHALERLAASGAGTDDIKSAREAVRQYLADINTQAKSITGVTGPIYFNRDGNAIKTVPIGVYRDRQLVSTPVQLSPTNTAGDGSRQTYQIAGGYFTPTRVVPTGIQINAIENIDLEQRTADIDFNIWFRHEGELDLTAIEFPNAMTPIVLDDPIEQSENDDLFYRQFRANGTFAMDFLPNAGNQADRVVGFQLRHRMLNRENLILTADLVGMEGGNARPLETRIAESVDLGEQPTHRVQRVDVFLDAQPVDVMGNPSFMGVNLEGFSRFNLAITLSPDTLSLSRLIQKDFALRAFLVIGFVIGVLGIFSHSYTGTSKQKWFWFPISGFTLLWLIVAEPAVVGFFTTLYQNAYLAEVAPVAIDALWWMLPAYMLARFMELFVWQPLELRTKREVPRVVRAFLASTFYILAALGVMAFVFDQKITSLLATSGVLAMIIGLAIQMNISNIFSGIAINVERPFRIGDWVRVPDHEPGRVVNITWRTTRLETIEKNIICIPNSVASDSTLENLSYPTEIYRAELMVHCDPGARPDWTEKILLDAVMSTPGVLSRPEAVVQFNGVQEWSAEYAVRFFCPNYEQSIPLSAAVWRQIVRNLRYAGFESVIHEEFTLFHLTEIAKQSGDLAPTLMRDVEVFEPFAKKDIDQLCSNMIRHRYQPKRAIIEQGDVGDSLFIVVEGALKVEIKMDNGKSIEVGRLGPGDFFGEMALLTGEPRGATITSLTPSQVYEVRKEHIQPIIEAYPDIKNDLSQILTRRELENLRRKKEHYASADEERNLAGRLLTKITDFFGQRGGLDRHKNANPSSTKPQATNEQSTAGSADSEQEKKPSTSDDKALPVS